MTPGTGASSGLEADKEVLKTARWGRAFVEVPCMRCKTCETPWGAQAPFSSQSNSLLGDQASDVISCLPPDLHGKSTLCVFSHRGVGVGLLSERSQHVGALETPPTVFQSVCAAVLGVPYLSGLFPPYISAFVPSLWLS